MLTLWQLGWMAEEAGDYWKRCKIADAILANPPNRSEGIKEFHAGENAYCEVNW